MQGTFLFIDAPKPGANPVELARILSIDAYRARMLAAAAAPFVAQGFPSLDAAARAATALDPAGFVASAHDGASVGAVTAAEEALSFLTEASSLCFTLESGARCRFAPGDVRVLVLGKLTVKITEERAVPSARLTRGLLGGIGGLAAAIDEATRSGQTERTVNPSRLEVFADTPEGPRRIGIRHDRFDFSALLARKTLSAVRNLDLLKESLARAGERVATDDAFARTELSRTALVPDVWNDDPGLPGSGHPAVAARSNRQAFDLYARLRWLHEGTRRSRGSPDHFLEL